MTPQTRFSAHLGYLYTELPLIERVSAAARAGFTAIEHPQPFGIPVSQMKDLLSEHQLTFAQLAGGFGDAAKGEKGLAALPGRQLDFREGFSRSLDYAVAVGASLVHPMAGVPAPEEAERWFDVYMDNISFAVDRTAGTSVTVLIEALSHAAVPGYAISTLHDAMAVQDAFGPGNIKLLLDTFHARANNVDATKWVAEHVHRVRHVHIADHPGRHEPGTGSFNFDEFLNALDEHHFEGAIGFEYIPSKSTDDSVAFLSGWKARFQPDQGN
jgi:hydroxypyruvate isomerase